EQGGGVIAGVASRRARGRERRVEGGGVAGLDGGRYAGLPPVEGGPQRAHPHARRRASQGGHSRERRLPRLGRHRHGWVGGTTGRRGGGECGVGGDAAGRWADRRVLPRRPDGAVVASHPLAPVYRFSAARQTSRASANATPAPRAAATPISGPSRPVSADAGIVVVHAIGIRYTKRNRNASGYAETGWRAPPS